MVGGYAVFQQQVAGRPPFEAVVPFSPFFEKRVMLPFDNTNGYRAGIALVNTDTVEATVTGEAFDEKGISMGSGSFTLRPASQRTFVLTDVFGSTANQRGMIQFTSSGRSMCSMGLRFHPAGAFTSSPPLSLPTW